MTSVAHTIAVLCDARALYEANPSHAPLGEYLAPGEQCAMSAIWNASGDSCPTYTAETDALGRAAGLNGGYGVVQWNAEHSTAEVLAAFDCAIADQCAVLQEQMAGRAVMPREIPVAA